MTVLSNSKAQPPRGSEATQSRIGLPTVVRPHTLTAQAQDALRKALMSGAFRPGERITTRAVAQELNSSTTPARDALLTLIGEGALELSANNTAIIPALSRDKLQEIADMRVALEGLAAEVAAPYIRTTEIDALNKVHDAINRAKKNDDVKTILEQNVLFHFTIYDRSHRPFLRQTIERLWTRMGGYLSLLTSADLVDDVEETHAAILKAARQKSAVSLRSAITDDIVRSSKALSAFIEDF